jgi:hypothetical protein
MDTAIRHSNCGRATYLLHVAIERAAWSVRLPSTALFRKIEPHDTMGKSLIPTLLALGSTGSSQLV